MTRTFIAALASTLLFTGLAHAAPPQDDTTVDAPARDTSRGIRHEGFVLRMSGGFSMMGLGIEPERSGRVGVAGGGNSLNVMVGGYLTRNLALHADLLAASSGYGRADVEGDGESSFDAEGVDMGAGGLGITYFVMPYNLGLTGSLLLAGVSAETRFGQSYATDYALLGKLGVTKEWAIAQDWAIGFGATALLGYGQGDDSAGEDFEAGIAGLSLDFVATYD